MALIATLGCLAACARPNYAERSPERFSVSGGAQPGYAIKQVVQRHPPNTLVADDGSVCRTSRERFAAAKEGSWIGCEWQLPDPDSIVTREG